METGDLKAVPGFGFLPHHVVAVTNLLFQVPPIYFELSTQLHFHFIFKEMHHLFTFTF